MPVYEYRCDQCGSFDQRREAVDASRPLPCPTCAAAARRVYTPLGGRSRAGANAGASAGDRARLDRARSGEPVVTGVPVGRRLRPGGSHTH
jgi:putative FmdB family regulatory protein